jgi:hypothetical protein
MVVVDMEDLLGWGPSIALATGRQVQPNQGRRRGRLGRPNLAASGVSTPPRPGHSTWVACR